MVTYPAPGRGAWRLTGGLLPAKPGAKGGIGYYRDALGSEKTIGAAWREDTPATQNTPDAHSRFAVFLGVIAIQHLVGAIADGQFGADTSIAATAAQARTGVEADGIIGPASMRAFLTPMIEDLASSNDVPVAILGGLLVNESGLDPAAVGVNGQDHGVAQIDLAVHPEVSLPQAMDPEFSTVFTARELVGNHRSWLGHTNADPWDIAIAAHNSPLLAKRWALSGTPPYVPGRVFQISQYVAKVRAAW